MAGHSHWAGIKHKKGALDKKRGKLFSKLARQIIVAARNGGGDPAMNLSLRYAVEKARAANMTKDTIERAVKKGTGELAGESYEEVRYEGYGPAGVAVIVQALTDNRNRTAADIRKIFEKAGGNLGAVNCVSFLFESKGFITVSTDAVDEDTLMEIALESGAENFEKSGDLYGITTSVGDFEAVKSGIQEREIKTETCEVTCLPTTTVALDEKNARKVLNMLDKLEEHDDVQSVYSNYDISEEVFADIEGSSA